MGFQFILDFLIILFFFKVCHISETGLFHIEDIVILQHIRKTTIRMKVDQSKIEERITDIKPEIKNG